MKPFDPASLTIDQIEALTRVAGSGAALVSDAMTRMTRQTIHICTPTVRALPVAQAAGLMGGDETLVVALHMRIHGPLRGDVLIAFSPETARWILEMILGCAKTPAGIDSLTRLEESALLEVGNTMAGSYLNALSNASGRSLLVSIPEMAIDMAGAIVQDILAEAARGAPSLPVIDMTMTGEPDGGRALMLHLPDPDTIPQLVSALCGTRDDQQGRHDPGGV